MRSLRGVRGVTRDRRPTLSVPAYSGPTRSEVADEYVDSHLAHEWGREDLTATNPCLRAFDNEEGTT